MPRPGVCLEHRQGGARTPLGRQGPEKCPTRARATHERHARTFRGVRAAPLASAHAVLARRPRDACVAHTGRLRSARARAARASVAWRPSGATTSRVRRFSGACNRAAARSPRAASERRPSCARVARGRRRRLRSNGARRSRDAHAKLGRARHIRAPSHEYAAFQCVKSTFAHIDIGIDLAPTCRCPSNALGLLTARLVAAHRRRDSLAHWASGLVHTLAMRSRRRAASYGACSRSPDLLCVGSSAGRAWALKPTAHWLACTVGTGGPGSLVGGGDPHNVSSRFAPAPPARARASQSWRGADRRSREA